MTSTTPLPDPARRRRASAPPVAAPAEAPTAPPPPPVTRDSGVPETTASVSFAPIGSARPVTRAQVSRLGEGHARVAVGPGVPGSPVRGAFVSGFPFPVSGPKIHPPLLRSDTLSRPRLNDWLDRAAAGRLGLIVAEAGFGKTTLLADWASKTNRRIAWYRLESDDRDWLVFLRHLVAAGRELDPDFGSDTLELLLSLGVGGPTQHDVAAAIVREYADFGAALPDGLTLIFDDHHVIDGSPETDAIVRALVERTGEGLSLVIASRAVPKIPLSKVRARGGVQRLDGEDLCFDVPETERLFREAYHHPLETDVVTELIKRTEGWAALLTLVRTGLEDKQAADARALVAQLSATRGDLYDFLAEEVLASLSPDMQRFLTRVSVLVSVDEECASIVDDDPSADVRARITDAENLGLLSRPDRDAPHRFHPLVRDFLYAHLQSQIGPDAVRALHRRVAEALESTDWFGAAWHYRAGGDGEASGRIIDRAMPSILASGTFGMVAGFLDGSAGSRVRPVALILRCRVELDKGEYESAVRLAREAAEITEGEHRGSALLNLAFVQSMIGYDGGFRTLAGTAMEEHLPAEQAAIADIGIVLSETQLAGDLVAAADLLGELARAQQELGQKHYACVSYHNRAWILLWTGEPEQALVAAGEAEVLLASPANGVYRSGVQMVRAHALTRLGQVTEADLLLDDALGKFKSFPLQEVALEGSLLEADFGEATRGAAFLAAADFTDSPIRDTLSLPAGLLALRRGDLDQAEQHLKTLKTKPLADVAGRLRTLIFEVRLCHARGIDVPEGLMGELFELAHRQRSKVGVLVATILKALGSPAELSALILALPGSDRYVLSMVAEEVCSQLHSLSGDALARVGAEASLRRRRWRSALLAQISRDSRAAAACADLLADIAVEADSATLRELARSNKRLRPMALKATRRLARPVLVEDLGNVALVVGTERLRDRQRRKVVGLLTYLAMRPGMSATRDEIVEALWGDLGAATAGNSVHQTIYFLRRVFEPDYRDGLSADYVEFDGEVVSLNAELVDSVSRRVWRVIDKNRTPTPDAAEQLLNLYVARFALDFAYEDWAAPYRENLHAAVLGFVEQAIARALAANDLEAVIRLARLMLAVDPEADAIELELLRAYKRSGRRSAAAEQYAHYAASLREGLGLDPPPMSEIT